MKAKELMIGDLVRVSKDVCIEKGAIVRVHAIDGDNNFPEKGLKGCVTCVRINDPDRMSGGVWAEYLEPIPLTAEILEKNGFEELMNESEVSAARFGRKPEPTGVWQYGFGQFDSVAYVFEQSFLRIKFMEGYTADIANIKYVHELQHALRLCGIEKEIIL